MGDTPVPIQSDVRERAVALIRAFQSAPHDTEIKFTQGELTDTGDRSDAQQALGVQVGEEHFAFLLPDARVLLRILEEGVRDFPTESSQTGFDELTENLREAINMIQVH